MAWEPVVFPATPTPIPHLGRRFDATGRFLPEAGNTVVAQVVPGSATQSALADLRAALLALPHADHFAFTDPASYHMTVFDGVVETRRDPSLWPAGISPDQDIDTATAQMAARLDRFAAPPAFQMRVTEVTPFGVQLAGLTPSDDANLRAWRDGLAAALALLRPDHDSYCFHTTLAYLKAHLPQGAVPGYRKALADLTLQMQARVAVMDLARPAFCRFADMNAFAPVVSL